LSSKKTRRKFVAIFQEMFALDLESRKKPWPLFRKPTRSAATDFISSCVHSVKNEGAKSKSWTSPTKYQPWCSKFLQNISLLTFYLEEKNAGVVINIQKEGSFQLIMFQYTEKLFKMSYSVAYTGALYFLQSLSRRAFVVEPSGKAAWHTHSRADFYASARFTDCSFVCSSHVFSKTNGKDSLTREDGRLLENG
jgi:hypothetical protein